MTSSHFFITAIHTLLRTFVDNLLQAVRKLRRIAARRRHLLLEMFDGDRNRGVSIKGTRPVTIS